MIPFTVGRILRLTFGVWILPLTIMAGEPICREGKFYVMGTLARIEACGAESMLGEAIERAYGELETVDRLMSLYRGDSELSILNRLNGLERVQPDADPTVVSPSTFRVIAAAVRLAEDSEGAFDPTVGPLVRLWGFYRGDGSVPTPEEVVSTRARVGFHHVRLDASRRAVRFDQTGLELDLGGLAKGHAVDRALTRLREAGATAGLVDLGESSVGLYGRAQSFAIRNPLEPDETVGTFKLERGCVSTSAGYQQGFEHEGEWYAHIIDPRDGWPVRNSLSATVLGGEGEAMKVDALSTAGFVAGPDEALRLWGRLGVEGVLYFRKGAEVDFVRTPGFPRLSR
jgi:thiamine biosynthesis lipoprotein